MCNRLTQKGFTLIEAMVAAVLVAIGFVGIFSLSGAALESMHKSIARERLLQTANQILEVMASDMANLESYVGNFNSCIVPSEGETDAIILYKFKWCSRIEKNIGTRIAPEVRSIELTDIDTTRRLATIRLEGLNGQIQIVSKRTFDK